ncbi:MAG: 2-amino-4-hydroxy-6-hydroxymethyldihydropteridine diphosphokinase [Caldisericia bacterium]|nr:2-amino-4-hydroxy-6-hydroxymethyldihydropteridine diphosphokinase [Caldisericia bacterium]MDD4614006.1 2-amino-4-hydroxy-6-hydroxymethyldihydropteridine diphosphokinase [Caldisericia bacterium]
MNTVFFSLGSNCGNRKTSLLRASHYLSLEGILLLDASSIIETSPYGLEDQYPFLNCVLKTKTNHSDPLQVLRLVKRIERNMGRRETVRWGPRNIDIDILFWNHELVHKPPLVIPHQDLHNRDFVLLPCLEICPTFIHPVFHKTIKQLWDIYNEK